MDVRTLAIDFDHVICASLPNTDVMADPPIPGALEALRFLMSKFAVYILTARNISEVTRWLKGHGFQVDDQDNGKPWTMMGTLLVTHRKIEAAAYIDDKAIRFFSWPQCIQDIETFAEWSV